MAFDNVVALPSRGKTYLTGPNRTADTTSTTSKAIIGIKKNFKDLDYSGNTVMAPRSGGNVDCILVRNSSGVSLLPKSAVQWKANLLGKEIIAYTATDYGPCAGIVDEWLPATGVANNDLFWIVVRGPTLALKSSDTTAINNGNPVAAITAAASTTSTTAGRIQLVAATSESTSTMSAALNRIGFAISTSNTSGASTSFLIYVDLPW